MIRIIAVGKMKDKHLLGLQNEFIKRIKAYHKIELIEVKDIDNTLPLPRVLELEAQQIFKHLPESHFCIVADLYGKMYTSESFTRAFHQIFCSGKSNISIVIGGSLGIDNSIRDRAQLLWKLSDLTFPHLLCRVLILEQIYRSYKIQNGETYHK